MRLELISCLDKSPKRCYICICMMYQFHKAIRLKLVAHSTIVLDNHFSCGIFMVCIPRNRTVSILHGAI